MPDAAAHPRRQQPQADRLRPIFRLGLMAFAALALVALFADIGRLKAGAREAKVASDAAIQDIILAPEGARYEDPGGLFSIVPPAGWSVDRSVETKSYDVVFRGPPGVDISIMATRVKYNTLPELMADIRRTEVTAGIATVPEPFFFAGRPALKRTARIHHSKIFAVDFVDDYVAHHILCAMPPEVFDRYEPVLMDVVNTYRPGGGRPAETR